MIDHVGYLVRDLDRPQWTLLGYFLGPIEVFTFTDPAGGWTRVSATRT